MSSSRCATRSLLLANRGSAGSNPSAPASFCHKISDPHDNWIGPVAVWNRPYGAIAGWCAPARPGSSSAIVQRSLECVNADDAGDQRGAYHTTSAGSLPFDQRAQDTERAVRPGQEVRDRDTDLQGLVDAGHAHQAGFALGDLVVTGAVGFRAVVAEPGDGQDHQPRVQLMEPLGAEPETIEHADPEVLHEHVGLACQPRQHLGVGLVLEIQDDRLFVAVRGHEIRRLPFLALAEERRPPAATVVAGAGVSTLMTRAPRSPSIMAACGPAKARLRSRTSIPDRSSAFRFAGPMSDGTGLSFPLLTWV